MFVIQIRERIVPAIDNVEENPAFCPYWQETGKAQWDHWLAHHFRQREERKAPGEKTWC
jgi:hypothetical protein